MKTQEEFVKRLVNEAWTTPVCDLEKVITATVKEWQAELEWRNSLPQDINGTPNSVPKENT